MAANGDDRISESFDYPSFIARNPGKAALKEYSDHQIVYAQGDAADALFFIVSGSVKIGVVSERGKEGVIALLGPGNFFGQAVLDGRRKRVSTATTTSACKIVRLDADVVMQALAADPAFSRVFVRFLLGRTEQLKADLIDQLFNSSEKRLARILLTLANTGIDTQANLIAFPISQEVLAHMVGTTRSRINQFMNKFRKLGYVEYDDRIKVYNSLMNVVLQEDADDAAP
jgi:CRP/FNR family transcriptional regulator, cyclic AMP receptor protein